MVGPAEQEEAKGDEEGRFDIEEEANGIDAFPDDGHVEEPEDEKASKLRCGNAEAGDGRCGVPGGEPDTEQREDGEAADPRLNAEPAAGDEGAHERGDVGTAESEGGAAINWEGDAVARAGV